MKLTNGAVECFSRGAVLDDPDVNAVGPNGDLFEAEGDTVCAPGWMGLGPSAPGWMGLGPRVGLQVGKHAHACGQERSSDNPELETKPGFRMSLMMSDIDFLVYGVDPETIKLMGRWQSDAMLRTSP